MEQLGALGHTPLACPGKFIESQTSCLCRLVCSMVLFLKGSIYTQCLDSHHINMDQLFKSVFPDIFSFPVVPKT